MIQKSYSKFFFERPSFILIQIWNSPNASQPAIDHHPLTLCFCISENSTTTTISIEGPDPVDAKCKNLWGSHQMLCVHPTLIGDSHFSIPFRRRSGHKEKNWIKPSFRWSFINVSGSWISPENFQATSLGGRTSQQPAWPVVVSQQLQLLATLGLSHPWPRCLTTCDLL